MKKSTKCFVEYDTKEQICLSDVNRRIRFSYYSMFLLLCLFFACSSENDLTNEETRELKLSVPLMDQEWLTTEKVDFEFEIVGEMEDTRRMCQMIQMQKLQSKETKLLLTY